MMPVISIVGKKKNGKTTFLVKLISEFKRRDYRVGAIKHDAHEFDIDHAGKDSWKITQAGADTTVISSSDKMAMVKKLTEEKNIDELVTWLFPDMDIVITEGYKRQNKPKIEVIRGGELICSEKDNLFAVIDNTENINFSLPSNLTNTRLFTINDIVKVVDLIEKSFIVSPRFQLPVTPEKAGILTFTSGFPIEPALQCSNRVTFKNDKKATVTDRLPSLNNQEDVL